MATYTPPAPQLSGDACLEIFAHHSLQTFSREPLGDGNRLALLGRPMLAAAYAEAVFHAMGDLHGDEFQRYIDGTLPGFVARWVGRYEWRHRMYGVPADVNLNVQEETARIFEAYAGAVVVELGQVTLFRWIRDLVNASV